jgi:hypothetical protein
MPLARALLQLPALAAGLTLPNKWMKCAKARFNLLVVSTSSGHYVHRDEPPLTIETIRRIFNFATQKSH